MTNTLEIIATPALVNLYNLEGKNVVVIDILRATSTICTALYNGAKSITPVMNLDSTLEYKDSDYLLAAERNGEKVKGFDFGNSPREYSKEAIFDKKIVLTTTNGTKAMHLSSQAKTIYIGSFLNLAALVQFFKNQKEDLVLFCAGWKDKFNLEDFLFAGALANELRNYYHWDCDATEGAIDLYNGAKADLKNYIQKASHAKRFERLGVTKDIALCFDLNACPVIPIIDNGEIVTLENSTNP